MIDIRDKHDRIKNQEGLDFEGLDWYAVGQQVRDSLLGREPTEFEFAVIDESVESMKEKGFTHVDGHRFTDGNGHLFEVAEGDDSLEAFLRGKDFTINAIGMTPGEQNYHFPLMNNYEEDDDRPEKPIDPIKDLDEKVIRHTTNQGFEQLDDAEVRLELMKDNFPDFSVADETENLLKRE
jgi:tRNA nucleotidyltransferase/poly(A) polymerase